MKLIRKQTAPIIIDQYGIQYPNLTLKISSINEDKLNKKISFICYYFYTKECQFEYLFRLGDAVFEFSNNYVNENSSNYGWPTYNEIKQDIMIDDDGNLIPLNNDVPDWILNQRYILDLEGKIFNENWEITN